ncbi:hypothetical protein O7599_10295 [Streptomyces sp. WMMC500]|uniref:hypothetical protein n=1 Tax=Streptomyces sp. WMMC500 TaxID=3015154 RepID=UPI00248D275D|nr:hypothetical protein [Streptomyces sp. WMMC500]WBB62885.1 hypothetical protein O7599_10295 [Streptomyces sp. WMMC500]
MRKNRMAGLAATVVTAVAGGALLLGAAGPVAVAAGAAGAGHQDGRRAAAAPAALTPGGTAPGGTAPAAADVDPATLHLLARLGQLTACTARTVELVQQAVADGGRLDPRTLPAFRSHLDAVAAAATAKGTVKSMKAQETTALAQAVAALREELDGLVRAGRAGDGAAVDERASVTVGALVRVLAATAGSGLVPAGQVPQVPAANAKVPPSLPGEAGA